MIREGNNLENLVVMGREWDLENGDLNDGSILVSENLHKALHQAQDRSRWRKMVEEKLISRCHDR